MATKNDKQDRKLLRRLLKGKRRVSSMADDTVDDETGSEGGSSSGGGAKRRRDDTAPPDRFPPDNKGGSYLVEDTNSMDRKRRLAEQEGHRQLAKVNARQHNEEEPQPTPEGELQNSIQQHPWLDAQRFDGIDPNLNPEPPLNTEARREFDNERREQEMEKQLRLGNMPKFSTAPKPSPP